MHFNVHIYIPNLIIVLKTIQLITNGIYKFKTKAKFNNIMYPINVQKNIIAAELSV